MQQNTNSNTKAKQLFLIRRNAPLFDEYILALSYNFFTADCSTLYYINALN